MNAIFLALLVPFSVELEPFTFTLDGRHQDPKYQNYNLELIDKFEILDSVSTKTVQRMVKKQAYPLPVKEQFTPLTGQIGYIDKRGELAYARVWSIPGREAFDKGIAAKAKSENAEVVGATSVTLTKPGEFAQYPRLKTVYYKYHDGLFAIGHERSILSLRLDRAAKWLRAAKSCYSFQTWDVSAIPKAYVSAIVGEARQQTLPRLQRLDGEPVDAAKNRKTEGLGKLRLVQILADGLQAITASTKWPIREGDQYVRKCTVVAAEGSELAGIFPKLSVGRRRIGHADDDALAIASVYAAIPNAVQPFVKFVSEALPEWAGELLRGAAEAGELQACFRLRDDQSGPTLHGAMHYPDIKLPQVPELVRAIVTGRQISFAADDIPTLERFRGFRFLVTRADRAGVPLLLAGTSKGEVDEQAAFNGLTDRPASRQRALAEVSFDFAKVAGGTKHLRKLLQEFESMADQWVYDGHRKRVEAQIAKLHPSARSSVRSLPGFKVFDKPPRPFRSLAEKVSADEQLELRGYVRIGGRRLTAELKMGRDLHQLYRARQLLAKSRLIPL